MSFAKSDISRWYSRIREFRKQRRNWKWPLIWLFNSSSKFEIPRVVTRDIRFAIWDFHQPIVWTVPHAKPICTSRSAYGLATASPETRYGTACVKEKTKENCCYFSPTSVALPTLLTFPFHRFTTSEHFYHGDIVSFRPLSFPLFWLTFHIRDLTFLASHCLSSCLVLKRNISAIPFPSVQLFPLSKSCPGVFLESLFNRLVKFVFISKLTSIILMIHESSFVVSQW